MVLKSLPERSAPCRPRIARRALMADLTALFTAVASAMAVSGLLCAVYAATQKSPAQEGQHGASALGLGGNN